jgi:hypothetical protein
LNNANRQAVTAEITLLASMVLSTALRHDMKFPKNNKKQRSDNKQERHMIKGIIFKMTRQSEKIAKIERGVVKPQKIKKTTGPQMILEVR